MTSIVSELLHHRTAARLASQTLDARRTAAIYWQAARRRLAAPPPAFLLSGLLRGRAPATAIYLGATKFLEDVDQTFFANQAYKLQLDPAALSAARDGVDFVIHEAWPWQTADDSHRPVVQSWLDARCDPGRDFQAFLRDRVSETVKRNLRKAQARGLCFRLDPSEEGVLRFLREVAIPMAQTTYGEESIVGAPERVLAWKGPSTVLATLLAEQDGVFVGGAVLIISELRAELLIHSYGLSPQVLADRKARAEVMAALNGWAFQTACEKGWVVNMGLTRPFLDQGVYAHKRQWGCHLEAVSRYPRFRLEFLSPRSSLLANAPLFYLSGAGVRGLAHFSPQGDDPAKELSDRVHAWVCEELRGLEIVAPAQAIPALGQVHAPYECPIQLAVG
jgi:hypothetical protein